jgi:valyl-tRNA synthetase
LYDRYKLSEALMLLYKLFWDDFSSWYLEIVKPDYKQPIDNKVTGPQLLFLTNFSVFCIPLCHLLPKSYGKNWKPGAVGESIVIARMPEPERVEKKLLTDFSNAMEIVSAIRTIRAEKNIPRKDHYHCC